jgi:hypothetical protein
MSLLTILSLYVLSSVNQLIMSIAVNHTGDVYEIDGLLINQNSAYLNNYFDIIVKQKAGVVITLHKVLAIDNWAALKLGEMYSNSIACNQLFYIGRCEA